jgi:hypothetical protein
MITKVGGRLKPLYLIKDNIHVRIIKNVRNLMLIIFLSVFVSACQNAGNNSNLSHTSNVAQQSGKLRNH